MIFSRTELPLSLSPASWLLVFWLAAVLALLRAALALLRTALALLRTALALPRAALALPRAALALPRAALALLRELPLPVRELPLPPARVLPLDRFALLERVPPPERVERALPEPPLDRLLVRDELGLDFAAVDFALVLRLPDPLLLPAALAVLRALPLLDGDLRPRELLDLPRVAVALRGELPPLLADEEVNRPGFGGGSGVLILGRDLVGLAAA